MFRRLLTLVPRTSALSTLPQAAGRPSVSSLNSHNLARIAVPSARGYHEKDMFDHLSFFVVLYNHYSNPRNVGSMPKADVDVGTGLVGAPACGDVMKLQIRVDKGSNTISDVKFKTFGCGSAIASSSYLTELVRGMTLEEAGKIRNTEIAKELCLPPVKLHCSMLAEDAIKSAISNYYTKNPKARSTDLSGTAASIPNVEAQKESAESTTA
ncbi:iron-binding protein [Blastomyces gilchristii]